MRNPIPSALPIEIKPTYPPSQAIWILGTELHIGPAHAARDQLVLICLGPGPQIQAIHGPAVPTGDIPWPPTSTLPSWCQPCTPEDASPVALVRLLRASATMLQRDIVLLAPDGTPAVPS